MRPLSLVERWDSPPFVAPTVSLAALLAGQRPAVSGASTAGLADYVAEIVNSGFPGFRHLAARSRRAALSGYIDRIVERDFPEAGRHIRNPASLRRWMVAYAAATSTTASYEKIRDASTSGHGEKPNRKATAPYIETLEQLYILDPIPAWAPSGAGSPDSQKAPSTASQTPHWQLLCCGQTPKRSFGRRARANAGGSGRRSARCSSRWWRRACASTPKVAKQPSATCGNGAADARWT